MMWYVDFRNSWCVCVCQDLLLLEGVLFVMCTKKQTASINIITFVWNGVRRVKLVESVVINNFHDFYVGYEKNVLIIIIDLWPERIRTQIPLECADFVYSRLIKFGCSYIRPDYQKIMSQNMYLNFVH